MFTDMVNYSALAQRNEDLATEVLEKHRSIVRPILRKHNGREVKTIGDAFLVEFASALEAVRCAVEIQSTLRRVNAKSSRERRILVRIGIHLGDVIPRGRDIIGDAVNVASRIEILAAPGGICVSAQVQASVANKVECTFETMGVPSLKNITTPVEVFRVSGPGGVGSRQVFRPMVASKNRIAVLPFVSFSPSPRDEYFADGLTEELISTMSRISGLKVIARTSVMGYKGDRRKKIDEIARELGVGTILEGSVRKDENRIRVTAQLIDAGSSVHLWADSYDRGLKDVFAIQRDISQTVANALQVRLLAHEKARLAKEPTKNAEAYSLCLRGIYHNINASSENDLRKALMYFERAIKLDSEFALAYSWLSDCYATLAQAGHMPAAVALPKAEDAVRKALELDPNLADAHRVLLLILIMRREPDWKGAEREITKALELNPSVPAGHESYAMLLAYMGRLDESLAEARGALELDPLSSFANQTLASVLYLRKDYDAAIAQLLKARDLDPTSRGTIINLGMNYLHKGAYDQAIDHLKRALQPSMGTADISRFYLACAYARAGRAAAAEKILKEMTEASRSKSRFIPAIAIAQIHAALGRKDEAVQILEKAYEDGDYGSLLDLKVSPEWDEVRSDPRFTLLVEKLGLG
jgi:TolB-like protein/Flp pilus assembly protein TadD